VVLPSGDCIAVRFDALSYVYATPGNTAFQVGAFSFDIEELSDGTVQYTMYNKAGWHSLLGGLNGDLGDHNRDAPFPMEEHYKVGGNVWQIFQWRGKKPCGCQK
jgi:hypothetical protein